MKLLRSFHFVFILSLIFCLWLGNYPIAAITSTPVLVQQGIKRYTGGDFRGAIDIWLQSLSNKDKNNKTESEIRVYKYLARAYQKIGEIDKGINSLNQVIDYYRTTGNMYQVGRILTEVAQAYSELGQHKRAINLLCGELTQQLSCTEDSALGIAKHQKDSLGEAAANGSLGNALYFLGEYDIAIQLLKASFLKAGELENSGYLMAAANNLGNLYNSLAQRSYRYADFASVAGDIKAVEKFREKANVYDAQTIRYFENSLKFSRIQNDIQGETSALLNLVLPYYRYSYNAKAGIAGNISTLNATVRGGSRGVSQKNNFYQKIFEQVEANIANLPPSRHKAFALIKMARLMQQVSNDSGIFVSGYRCFQSKSSSKVINLFKQAVTVAENIGDKQAQSFALGWLGQVYECSGNYQRALYFTNQAQLTAASKESRYLWEWQAGRIFKLQNKESQAIEMYENSANTLADIEEDIAIANRDVRLDFQDSVETIYRQLTELKIKSAQKSSNKLQLQQNLNFALNTLDKLKLAELRNYLGNDCDLQLIDKSVALIDKNTAVFRSILLEDGIAIILMLPDANSIKLKMHWVPIEKKTVIETVNQLRRRLEKLSDRQNSYQEKAQEIYNWFIRPFATELEQIKTLVFVQDGILWTIPMASLYDGKQFLVEKYAIANTPSLSLTSPQPLNNQALKVLAFGLTNPSAIDEKTFFPPLNAVKAEMQGISKIIPYSKIFLNQNFTSQLLEQKLLKHKPTILHLATHARFGYDSRQTFLITGAQKDVAKNNPDNLSANPKQQQKIQNYNETITLGKLYQIIQSTKGNDQQMLELLTLTGCQTAAGSKRDALGIAGVSVQAGAKSSVASLWNIDDEATARLIVQFYENIRQGMSKAEALQATQKTWLAQNSKGRYSHPGYWAPFILVGNWL